jgi:hypothetical protein
MIIILVFLGVMYYIIYRLDIIEKKIDKLPHVTEQEEK